MDVPGCKDLTPDVIRTVLVNMNDVVRQLSKNQERFIADATSQIELRPTLGQVLTAVEVKQGEPVVSLRTLQKVLQDFESRISLNLNIVQKTAEKYEILLQKLLESSSTSLRLSHIKYQKSQDLSRNILKFVLNHIHQLHLKNKKRRIFKNWKDITKNKQTGAKKLVTLENSHKANIKLKSFTRWSRVSSKISSSRLSASSDLQQNKLEKLLKEIETMKVQYYLNRVLSLQENKADQKKIKEIESLALKADVRVMFQDIKSIIKSHTENIRSKYEEELKAVTQDLRFTKETISQKADFRPIKEHLDMFLKLRSDFLDLSKSHSTLLTRMNSFDGVLQKENTDFKIDMLDRKILVVEQRLGKIFEEKNTVKALATTVCSFPSPKRPSTSVNRNALHSRKNSSSYV